MERIADPPAARDRETRSRPKAAHEHAADRGRNPHRSHTMNKAAEQEYTHIGETSGAEDHDHDLIHELSKRLDAVWRFDQYIANADGKPQLQEFWRELKGQEVHNVDRLKQLIAKEVADNCF